jgi:RNA polymerase sigma factor (sigma-70 family)
MDVLPKSLWEPASTAFADAWPRLVRLCSAYTGVSAVAEDLAQETLLVAWRRRDRLKDPQALVPWLTAIARNICRHWLRAQRRATLYEASISIADGKRSTPNVGDMPDPFDIEVALERDELSTLLDRALALLPPDTRDALIQHYIAEQPHAALAEQFGISTGAVAVRLHRGRVALRQTLLRHFPDEARDYGIVPPPADTWRTTRVWCPICGAGRLLERQTADCTFQLDCLGCLGLERSVVFRGQHTQRKSGQVSTRAALTQLLQRTHTTFAAGTTGITAPCWRCRAPSTLGVGPIGPLGFAYVTLNCPACGQVSEAGTAVSCLALAHPAGRHFWRQERRLRTNSDREVERNGQPAIVSTLEAVDGRAQLHIVFSRQDLRVLVIDTPYGTSGAMDGGAA